MGTNCGQISWWIEMRKKKGKCEIVQEWGSIDNWRVYWSLSVSSYVY